ncbi:Uncharacterized protein TCM_003982 [Theobroma cacao]|uniref:Uncharacterized protein n=1 Tax=Theobroma cacao TaxID=3641 RepID=A0A061DPP3_THECC|nr:Uncharacterized protein TCM_003982 [Theobroma cacao]
MKALYYYFSHPNISFLRSTFHSHTPLTHNPNSLTVPLLFSTKALNPRKRVFKTYNLNPPIKPKPDIFPVTQRIFEIGLNLQIERVNRGKGICNVFPHQGHFPT